MMCVLVGHSMRRMLPLGVVLPMDMGLQLGKECLSVKESAGVVAWKLEGVAQELVTLATRKVQEWVGAPLVQALVLVLE